jgi:hypothetical protein
MQNHTYINVNNETVKVYFNLLVLHEAWEMDNIGWIVEKDNGKIKT